MDLFPLLSLSPSSLFGTRSLQSLPDYTSPPLPSAIDATPEAFRSDAAVDAAREYDAKGLCQTLDDPHACQIIFSPPSSSSKLSNNKGKEEEVGVVFYGGALVDPRGYSPMMTMLSEKYGLSVAVPIFADDLAFKFGTCESGRVALAQQAFPNVTKWVLAGHSFGGLVALNDIWAMVGKKETESLAGLALIGSYVRQDIGCGEVDFSGWDWLPAASVSASNDGVINMTNFEAGQQWLPSGNNTLTLVIEGANHGQFGTYDDSGRATLLNQTDGVATISTEEQQEQAASAIAYVATRGRIVNDDDGGKLPPTQSPLSSKESIYNGTVAPTQTPTIDLPSSALMPSHHLYLVTTPMAVALAVWWAI